MSSRSLLRGLRRAIRRRSSTGPDTIRRERVVQPFQAGVREGERPRFSAARRAGAPKAVPPITYRPYRPGDETSIMQGFNETFGLSRDEAYWRWKFCSTGPPLSMLAVDASGRVQAQFSGIRLNWVTHGTRLPVAQICDFFARRDPEVIRGRVMMRTLEAFQRELADGSDTALIFGFPNRTSAGLYNRHRAFVEGARPVRTLRRDTDSPRRDAPAGGAVTRGMPAQDYLDDLWRRASERYRCACPRDAGWLYWRFRDRPDVDDYVVLSCVRGNEALASWLVLRMEGETLWICDLVWDGLSDAELALLDDAVAEEGRRLRARNSGVWLQGDEEAARVLLERGWRDHSDEQTIHFSMHAYDTMLDTQAIYSDLYLTRADSDLI